MQRLAIARALVANPSLHPTTQTLRNSIPEPDPARKWSEEVVLAKGKTEGFLQAGDGLAACCRRETDIVSSQMVMLPEQGLLLS